MAQTELQPSRDPLWSPWGDRLIAVLAVGLALCLVWWWVGSSYFDLPLSTYLSWKPFDQPTQVPPHVPEALLKWHYFGDFQESRWWGLDVLEGRSPYRYVNIYPPFAPLLMVPFAALPLPLSLMVYLAGSIAALLIPAWMLLRGLRSSQRILVVALVAGATAPFLATVDRGNLQGITIGLVGLSLVALQRRRLGWACVALAVAISLKPFVLVVALAALARRRRTFASNTIALALALSVVAWLVLPGVRTDNLINIIVSQFQATGGPDLAFGERIWANVGLHGLVSNVEFLFSPSDNRLVHLPQVPLLSPMLSVAWIAGVSIVVWRRRVPQWVWATLVLATLQLAQPYASMYTASWATLAAVWFGTGRLLPVDLLGQDNERVDRWVTCLRLVGLGALVATLLPIALRPELGGVEIPVQQMLSPALWIAFAIVAITASFVRESPTRTTPPPEALGSVEPLSRA